MRTRNLFHTIHATISTTITTTATTTTTTSSNKNRSQNHINDGCVLIDLLEFSYMLENIQIDVQYSRWAVFFASAAMRDWIQIPEHLYASYWNVLTIFHCLWDVERIIKCLYLLCWCWGGWVMWSYESKPFKRFSFNWRAQESKSEKLDQWTMSPLFPHEVARPCWVWVWASC